MRKPEKRDHDGCEHADEILTRDATKHLVDQLKQTSPAVVDELIPTQMKLAEVQQKPDQRSRLSAAQLGNAQNYRSTFWPLGETE